MLKSFSAVWGLGASALRKAEGIRPGEWKMRDLTLSEIEGYLSESRKHLENSALMLSNLSCLGYVHDPEGMSNALHNLYETQRQLELEANGKRYGSGQMGFWTAVIIAGGVALSALGAWVYTHYTQTKSYSDYLDCLDRMQKAGMSPEEAAYVCKKEQGGTMVEATNLLKWAIGGTIAVFALYLIWQMTK